MIVAAVNGANASAMTDQFPWGLIALGAILVIVTVVCERKKRDGLQTARRAEEEKKASGVK